EAQVELAPAGAADVDSKAVVDRAAGLVTVEAPVQELAQPAPVHALSPAVDVLDRPGQRVPVLRAAVLKERRRVAVSEEPQAYDGRADGCVGELVDLARLEAAFDPDVLRAGFRLAVHFAGESPLRAFNEGGLGILMLSY